MQQTFSDLLGYTSIACWLGAQFPQVLENIRSGNCDGLALPFLANWLMGDISNLVGCILTHQLPFQTYLATYFVFVDCTLVGQYIYYAYQRPPPPLGHPRLYSTDHRDRPGSRYRTLSSVVAKAAAIAAAHDEYRPYPTRRLSEDRYASRLGEANSREVDGEGDEEGYAALADSFHSDLGGRRSRVSWSVERPARRGASIGHAAVPTSSKASVIPPAARTMSTVDVAALRGRSMMRSDANAEAHAHTTASKSARRGNSSIVYFGVWALVGVGMLARHQHGLVYSGYGGEGRGMVLSAQRDATTTPPIFETLEADAERVLGRIFAWLCTTLYLTSRLPQIWKNYARKSVAGLSMYLFIFAFLGNVFYVSSILTSPNAWLPQPASGNFIRESIPYLLGSGGTLIFDITIVAQSFIYRPKHLRRASMEEEARLLPGDNAMVASVESL
ncbi:hypothetical protein CYLTODRAFT_418197 [Cylindrobasidium torrendii FP15055 ss-10]|uniref:PQ-loop-domain-containing protein n=1 Tax=Cylindrobasidium torrendii FP15055 ss-10 TaxID=1314674 RepID=A0A0D7BPY4_9AGAR|nr:hypothetical protein CYLTODRAFT_418197 [Cylindrobasidium torrendii FP15055 ss-10]